MLLSLEDVKKIALLARLRLDDREIELFSGQLSVILLYVEQLNQLDVSQVEPMTHALAAGEATIWREDQVKPSCSPDEALANAPAREGTCFKVPRIIE